MNLITSLSINKEALSQFFATFFMQICRDIFIVLTDSLHKSGFKLQAEILRRLIIAIESKEVVIPISAEVPDNKQYVREYLVTALSTSFPNISKTNVMGFVDAMFANCGSWEPFKTTVRDFLITMKEFAEDSELLYSEERQVILIYTLLDPSRRSEKTRRGKKTSSIGEDSARSYKE